METTFPDTCLFWIFFNFFFCSYKLAGSSGLTDFMIFPGSGYMQIFICGAKNICFEAILMRQF